MNSGAKIKKYKSRIILAHSDSDISRHIMNKIKSNNFNIIAHVTSGKKLIKLSHKLKPDAILTGISLSGISGLKATRELRTDLPGMGIIALYGNYDINFIVDMINAGANGFVRNQRVQMELIPAIKTVLDNHTYFCLHTTGVIHQLIKKNKLPVIKENARVLELLTDYEIEILKLMCKGLTNGEMGDFLGKSSRTVEGYRENIIKKTGAKNTASMVVFAIQHRIYEI